MGDVCTVNEGTLTELACHVAKLEELKNHRNALAARCDALVSGLSQPVGTDVLTRRAEAYLSDGAVPLPSEIGRSSMQRDLRRPRTSSTW
jgi:hypothetical protein